MGLHKTYISLALLLLALSLAGCDPVNRHMVLSTIFDGVPSLPEPAQMCAEYNDKRVEELKDQLAGKVVAKDAGAAAEESVHRPYGEKKCDDCHDKSKDSGLVRPPNELCLMCHKNFFKGAYLHGPAAVGDCLACHVPHNSPDGPLLKMPRTQVCNSCHKEQRAAVALHDKVAARKMACVECHNPHDGNSPFFLK